MKDYEIVGWVKDGSVLCVRCVGSDDEATFDPIFAGNEGWEDMSCGICSDRLEDCV